MASNSEVESVWDYPRPPRLEPTSSHLRVVHRGVVLADTNRALRILETSHPPVYYIPQSDIAMQFLEPSNRRSSFCEFKGSASYWTVDVSASLEAPELAARRTDAAWSYRDPSSAYAALRNYLAFYANRVDECMVNGERVVPQVGDFYGGWITSNIKGPFKGAPGTLGW
ncbi:DUF427 domain-containing protein [Granulicella sp. S190]|uniref:DUF427 domain-containing protein n=1 Tax=Granulicella sp. S190 TaxID=1747226 RepID=UPI00131A994B|nr:DUF427 domain-containing protein [Granulicella sp. S190]